MGLDNVKLMIPFCRTGEEDGKEDWSLWAGPGDFPEMAQFLVQEGIDSISFNPDALVRGIRNIFEAEKDS